jgi:hypothetical protein
LNFVLYAAANFKSSCSVCTRQGSEKLSNQLLNEAAMAPLCGGGQAVTDIYSLVWSTDVHKSQCN